MVERSLICVIDDDESVRESLPDLITEFGFAVRAFSSGEAFLASDGVAKAKCLVVDIAMPGMRGPDLQRELKRRKRDIPIIFITAYSDDVTRQQVLKQGAAAYLLKPFSDTSLREAIATALHAA